VSAPLHELRDTLVALHAGGARVGLPPRRAEQLVDALARGDRLSDAAAAVGLLPELAEAADAAPSDRLPQLLMGLARAAADVEGAERRLRGAGFYPTALALSVAISGFVVVVHTLPTLAQSLASRGLEAASPPVLLVAAPVVLLLALGALVVLRVPVPGLLPGFARARRFGFLQALRVLTAAGVPLAPAVAGAGRWLRRQEPARALGQALEAGRDPGPISPLLGRFESSMLAAAARAGAEAEACAALADVARISLERELADNVARVQVLSLLLAGGALACIGVLYFSEHARVLVG
jgi:type II secretory pathway component PulF